MCFGVVCSLNRPGKRRAYSLREIIAKHIITLSDLYYFTFHFHLPDAFLLLFFVSFSSFFIREYKK